MSSGCARRVAVVTGCMGKLGKIWIDALLDEGFLVFGIDNHGTKSSTSFNKLHNKYSHERLAWGFANILRREQLERCEKECSELLGTVSVLVNNAGIDQPPESGESYRLEDIPADKFIPTLEINTFGAFLAAQVFGKRMIETGNGNIINVGSLYATVSPDERVYDHVDTDLPFLKPPAYGASKAALHNITQYLAAHWARYGIRVNTLSPGGVEGGQDAEFREKFCSRVPMGRMANAGDLTGPLLFLATDASRYVTGINLQVDGGYTLW